MKTGRFAWLMWIAAWLSFSVAAAYDNNGIVGFCVTIGFGLLLSAIFLALREME